MSRYIELDNPSREELAESPEAFLKRWAGPICIRVDGVDRSRTRALTTLIHGNEPSGFTALHRWLCSGEVPAVNLLIMLPSVKAALTSPLYSHRVLPGFRDLNRCFHPPYSDSQGELAKETLDRLSNAAPEALVDMHNTSGSGPGFGVVCHLDSRHESLVGLFCERVIVTDLRLGALIEVTEQPFPIVTIECGGRADDAANELAWKGLCRYLREEDVLTPASADWSLELLNKPMRVELVDDCHIVYAEQYQPGSDLTLRPDVEHYNFGLVHPETPLGWLGDRGLACLQIPDTGHCYSVESLFQEKQGVLYPARTLKLFMITCNPEIALMDCLCYAVVDKV